ncbi:hypothetical protein [Sulfitobacter sp. R18_1]|uniref:hypothetical protein n=1 Tax=Sulfitobacter sp. R18_1 TaxID=2821104 RepID=UPI001ADC6C74|nr:hypothetical protein [Sulfitobacter sp. R18_1]MBO9428151.1 hypothetical protein [Sulfitobacter sp. R18_1]
MALLFMAFMIVAMILNWYLYRSHLAHLNENPEDISLSIGEVTWAELLATLAIYALVSFALSWAFSDNLQRPFLESCWEQTGTTEACIP